MRTAEGFEPWYAAEFPRLVASLRMATGDAGLAEEAAAEACASPGDAASQAPAPAATPGGPGP